MTSAGTSASRRRPDWAALAIGVVMGGMALASLVLTFPPYEPAEVPGEIDGCGRPCLPAGRTWDGEAYLGLGISGVLGAVALGAVVYALRSGR